MAKFNGNLLVATIGTSASNEVAFAHSTSGSLSFSNSVIDVTTKDSQSWDEVISGRKSFSVSADGLADFETVADRTNFPTFSALALAGTVVFFEITNAGDGFTGQGIIESFEISGESDGTTTYSCSIKGSGPLTAVSA